MWLVLTADKLVDRGDLPPRFGKAVAFNAHLTNWRTPETATSRCTFYVLNHLRTGSYTWYAPDQKARDTLFQDLFTQVFSPQIFQQAMSRHHTMTVGLARLNHQEAIAHTPLRRSQERTFAPLYDAFLSSLGKKNQLLLSGPQVMLSGEALYLDVSTPDNRRALGEARSLQFGFESTLAHVEAQILTLRFQKPWEQLEELSPALSSDERAFSLDLGPEPSWNHQLRRVIRLVCTSGSGQPLLMFEVKASETEDLTKQL